MELSDFDVTRPLDADEQAELRRLFTEHHLLLAKGQTPEDHDRFVGYFGPLGGAIYTTNQETPSGSRVQPGQGMLPWHSDGMYESQPGIATSLWAIDVSPHAIPTVFANGVRALDQLPGDLRAQVESLHGVYYIPWTDPGQSGRRLREADIPAGVERPQNDRGENPIVYELPHAHKKTLFVDQFMISHIVELPLDESEALIQELWDHIYADENTYTHRWEKGDIIIWDNIALQHTRPADMGSEVRHLRRQIIRGWYTDEGQLDWGPARARSYDT